VIERWISSSLDSTCVEDLTKLLASGTLESRTLAHLFRPIDPYHMTLTGLSLGGRYCIEHRVGQGGMADVYFARDLETDSEVAIKVLLPQLASDPESVKRLQREAVIAMRLKHPNVCEITDTGETPEGHLYLVMPFLRGEPLAIHEARYGTLSVSDGIALLVQVCRGLGHAHGLGILHRDLKPENVMLVPDREAEGGLRAVLMDFGLAKVIREEPDLQKLTRSGVVLGTPDFMSPEQLLGKDIDGRTDLYATGVLAFEMFTGRVPFEGNNVQEVALFRLKNPPLRLRAVQPELPEKLEMVIARALAQRPEDRFQTMDELGVAFAAVTDDRPRVS
jgi:eukaryotic-like serine/threonine-protein kinase